MDRFEDELKQQLNREPDGFGLRGDQMNDLAARVEKNRTREKRSVLPPSPSPRRGLVIAAVTSSVSLLAVIATVAAILIAGMFNNVTPPGYSATSDLTAPSVPVSQAQLTDYVDASLLPPSDLGLDFVEARIYTNEDVTAALEVKYEKVFLEDFTTKFTFLIMLHDSFSYSLDSLLDTAASYFVNGTEVLSADSADFSNRPLSYRKFTFQDKLFYCFGEGIEAAIVNDIALGILS